MVGKHFNLPAGWAMLRSYRRSPGSTKLSSAGDAESGTLGFLFTFPMPNVSFRFFYNRCFPSTVFPFHVVRRHKTRFIHGILNSSPGLRIIQKPQSLILLFFGCVGSSFLCEHFLQLWQAGATLHRGARASHYRGLSCCGAQAPDAQAQ